MSVRPLQSVRRQGINLTGLCGRTLCVPSRSFFTFVPQAFLRALLALCFPWPLHLRPLDPGALRSRTGLPGPRFLGHSQGRFWPLGNLSLCAPLAFGFGRSAPRPGLCGPRCSGHLQGRLWPPCFLWPPCLRPLGFGRSAFRPGLYLLCLGAPGICKGVSGPLFSGAFVLPASGFGRSAFPSRPLWASMPRAHARASLAPCLSWTRALGLGSDARRPTSPAYSRRPGVIHKGVLSPLCSGLLLVVFGSGRAASRPGLSGPWCPVLRRGRPWPPCMHWLPCLRPVGSGALCSRPGLLEPLALDVPRAFSPLYARAFVPLALGLRVRALCVPSLCLSLWASLPLALAGVLWPPCLPWPLGPPALGVDALRFRPGLSGPCALGVSRALSPARTTAVVPPGFLPLGSGALRSPSRHLWASVPGALAWHWPALPFGDVLKAGVPLCPH